MRGVPDTTDLLFDAFLDAATRDDLPDLDVSSKGRVPGRPELRACLASIAAIARASRPRARGAAGGACPTGSPETFTCPRGEGDAPGSTSGVVGARLALDVGGVAS